jgi:glycosyltransferase involved in cell wall biosynthesis
MPSLDIVIPAYNAARCLDETLEAVFRQRVPQDLDRGIIVVNNGSTDATAERIDAWAGRGVRRVDHGATRSRAAARNAGVAASKADYVLLLDADCRLVGADCLGIVSDAIGAGVAAGFGYATGEADSFWGRYHHALEQARGRADWLGWTTQCCLVKRTAFDAVGGFCEAYRHYGFEDRDFFCRLRYRDGIGALVSLPGLRVYHDPDTTIEAVCAKAYEAARHSSGIFLEHFEDDYLRLPYARVDALTGPGYMLLALRVLGPFRPLLLRFAGALTRRPATPLAIGRPLIRLCSALSYYDGTLARSRAA